MNMLHDAQQMQDELIAIRRHLHQNPELGLDLPMTAAFVEEKLKEMGYEPKRIGDCGIVAVAGKKEGKCFLIRGDMDALPVQELADVDYKSTNGAMHACGHDCHTTAMLGAAKLLKMHEDELEGQVKLMFQPAEETMDGGKMMVEGGVLKNPDVDAAMAIHVFTNMDLPVGSVILSHPGSVSAAVDWFTVHVTGKGCHGAMPHNGIDPLNAAAHILIALQAINARELDPADNLVLTIGQIHGGNTSNVIPNDCMMSGTIRTLKNETRAMVKARMEAMVKSIGEAFGATAYVEWGSGCPVLTRDAHLADQVKNYLNNLEGLQVVDMTHLGASKGMGSEDFACVANEVPSAFLQVAAGGPKEGCTFPQHHPKAVFMDGALAPSAATYAHVAMSWLKENK